MTNDDRQQYILEFLFPSKAILKFFLTILVFKLSTDKRIPFKNFHFAHPASQVRNYLTWFFKYL